MELLSNATVLVTSIGSRSFRMVYLPDGAQVPPALCSDLASVALHVTEPCSLLCADGGQQVPPQEKRTEAFITCACSGCSRSTTLATVAELQQSDLRQFKRVDV